jgi:hypothetical protein
MSFPEWGHSYNALYVPLRQWGWQCALMPAGEVKEEGSFNGSFSFEEREKKRRERKKQIEQDKDDFHRLFSVDIDPRDAVSSFEFKHYADFIRDVLRTSGGDLRDGDGITRVLHSAVRGPYRSRDQSRVARRPTGVQALRPASLAARRRRCFLCHKRCRRECVDRSIHGTLRCRYACGGHCDESQTRQRQSLDQQ